MHTLRYAFLTVVCFFALCLFTAITSSSTPPSKLKVGMILTLSGNFASAGEDCRKGIEAGITNEGQAGVPEPVYSDSRNEPAVAISEFRKLAQLDGVIGVYTHRSSMGMALNPISQSSRIPLLGAVGNKDFAAQNQFAIQVWPRSDEEGYFTAEKLIKRNFKRAALLYTEDEYTTAVSKSFRERFTALGGELVFDQLALPTDHDFHTLVTQIKAKSPEVFYANMLLPQIGPVIKQAREKGISGPIYSNFFTSRKDVMDAAGADALENVRYIEMDTELPLLKKKLNLSEDVTPAGLTVASYVAARLLVQAAADKANPKTAGELQAALFRQQVVHTPDHDYPIKDRYIQFPLVVKIMRNGKGAREK